MTISLSDHNKSHSLISTIPQNVALIKNVTIRVNKLKFAWSKYTNKETMTITSSSGICKVYIRKEGICCYLEIDNCKVLQQYLNNSFFFKISKHIPLLYFAQQLQYQTFSIHPSISKIIYF